MLNGIARIIQNSFWPGLRRLLMRITSMITHNEQINANENSAYPIEEIKIVEPPSFTIKDTSGFIIFIVFFCYENVYCFIGPMKNKNEAVLKLKLLFKYNIY